MTGRSITFRLILWYCALLLFLGVLFGAYTVARFETYTRQTTQAILSTRADEVWRMAQGLLGRPGDLAQLIERRFGPEVQNRLIRISFDGKVIYQSGAPAERGFDPVAIPVPAANALGEKSYGALQVYSRSYPANGGAAIVESGQSDDFARPAAQGLIASLIEGLPWLLLFAAAGGYVLMRRALAPVEMMIKGAEALTFNSPHKRLPLAATSDRIEALGKAINRMLLRLDNAYQHASRFSADAAHELRTPLAIIRGELEFCAAQKDLPHDMQVAIGNVLEEATRLSNMVESLITLGRMESIWGKTMHSEVELNALAEETIDQMRLLAEEKGVKLHGPSGPKVAVAGDRDRLKQVLVNLIDNAIKYTPAGKEISVEIGTNGDAGSITVSDSGIGIERQAQRYIFDRFYRVAADRGETGAGLGLAIVKSICEAHGGQVSVESAPAKGSRFRVELPLAQAAKTVAPADPARRDAAEAPSPSPLPFWRRLKTHLLRAMSIESGD